MIRYYQERNGDFFAVNTETRAYYNAMGQRGVLEGRATCIAGLVTSVCTTGIGSAYRKQSKRVDVSALPAEWLRAIGLD